MDQATASPEVPDNIANQESILLQMIREVCAPGGPISQGVKAKVNKILSECDLSPYLSLHRFNTVDEGASTLLGLMHKTATELTYDEQSQLNQAIIQTIQNKLPILTSELDTICGNRLATVKSSGGLVRQHMSREERMKELTESIDDKLNTLKEQEGEKVELMMEWLNHKLRDVVDYSDSSAELHAVKIKTLELKSKILHLQILHGIFTETNRSIEAYSEVHRDLQDSIRDTQRRIDHYKHVIQND